ncbi:MAG TPA: TadE family protein [Stellaceae bacterium]|nr:TadE family protein [Stellaceae bacterium]
MWRRLTRATTRDDGTSAIEFALCFPVFILMVLGIFEFSRALWTNSLLNYAVQSAARCSAVDSTNCGSTTATVSYAVQSSSPLTIPSADFTASTQSCGSQVSVAFPFTFVVPQLFPYNITLSAQACYPKQT